MATYLITDTHLGHSRLLLYGTRPQDFTEQILEGLRRTLLPGDTLIHLGDVCMAREPYWHNELMKHIPSGVLKVLVQGNHDKRSKTWYLNKGWDRVTRGPLLLPIDGESLVAEAVHIPRPITSPIAKYQIHGHLHGNAALTHPDTHIFSASTHVDIAPEVFGYNPILLDDILKRFEKLDFPVTKE